ncbi:MAG: LPS export ABC transporter ATP-binding protein [Deltaproteobacteria bacterium]|nr:MAG: LPS export ABC transporter ATP-binding protein [Deltaproteobacteria bacterium]
MTTLEVRKLVKRYNRRTVVNQVSMTVESGRVTGLLGPNGAGKTTTFYMTVGMIHPDKGSVLLSGEDITTDPMYRRSRKGIGYLPQEASIFRKLTVYDNIETILEFMPLTAAERRSRIKGLLDELGILKRSGQKAGLLSGGERRRLEISRVLATDPKFVLLDEPFAGVDPLAVADIRDIIRHLTNRGIGVLISDHNVRETLSVCDTAYILSQGSVIESGSPNHIANSEIARRIYLGKEFRL